jgi:heme exporter protein A
MATAGANTAVTLELDGLGCTRGDTALFAGLDYRLAGGETLHVRGANGSGKSSLLRILAGLAQPDAGEVRWCGTATHALGSDYGAVLHYVGHHNGIKLDLTAAENLAFQAALAGAGGTQVDSALAQAGIAAAAALPARRLSAGQRRRLALARLLLYPAPLWLLDEPLTSLDADGRALFTALMRQHADEGGIVIMATHEPAAGAGPRHRELRLS